MDQHHLNLLNRCRMEKVRQGRSAEMDNVLSEALDQAIACLAQGWSVEETLQAFPAAAEQLRPLLPVCAALQHLAQGVPRDPHRLGWTWRRGDDACCSLLT
jgi:hypothetical protein